MVHIFDIRFFVSFVFYPSFEFQTENSTVIIVVCMCRMESQRHDVRHNNNDDDDDDDDDVDDNMKTKQPKYTIPF